MVQQAVRRYAGNPTVIGIDPLVEPNAYARHGFLGPEEFYATYGQTSEDVNLLHARATAAVRALSDVPLLLEGDGYGSLGYLPHLRITGDPRTVYTAHYYEPRAFTHQDPGAGLAYPGLLPIGSSPTRVDKAFQERQLAPLQAFQQQHGVPVAVTEFGVHRYAPGAAAYLTDAMSIFDAMGASSALWEFVVRAQRPLFNDFDPQGGPDPAVRIAVRNPVQAAVEDGLRARCVQPAPPLPAATSEPSGSRPPRSRVLPLLLVAVAAAGAAALATRRQWRRRRRW
jgi:hypothetical protein